MKDTTQQNDISIESFQTLLIISEIVVTAIALYGLYRIFNSFNKKNKEFKQKQQK